MNVKELINVVNESNFFEIESTKLKLAKYNNRENYFTFRPET